MLKLREAGWQHTLTDVEQAVGDCLAALDRYEAAFAGVLADHARPPAVRPHFHLFDPHPPQDEFHTRLANADRRADEVEQLLAEQEAVWAGWQTAYAAWRRSLEQPPAI